MSNTKEYTLLALSIQRLIEDYKNLISVAEETEGRTRKNLIKTIKSMRINLADLIQRFDDFDEVKKITL